MYPAPIAAVADALLQLTFGEMIKIASDLADVASAGAEFDASERNHFALLLQYWAENYGSAS